MLRILVLACVLSASLVSAQEVVVVRYVGGTVADLEGEPVLRNGRIGGGCFGLSTVAVHVGGACGVTLSPGLWRVQVADDVTGPRAFEWSTHDALSRTCASGVGESGATLALPAGCEQLRVYTPLGSTTGEITVTSA